MSLINTPAYKRASYTHTFTGAASKSQLHTVDSTADPPAVMGTAGQGGSGWDAETVVPTAGKEFRTESIGRDE